MKTDSLRIQYKVLTKIFQEFLVSDRQSSCKISSTPEHSKIWQFRTHPKRVTGNKHPAPGLYSRTLESSPQLQLSNNSFGTYSQLDQNLDPVQVSGVSPKSLLFCSSLAPV